MQKIQIVPLQIIIEKPITDLDAAQKQRNASDELLSSLLAEGYVIKSEYLCERKHSVWVVFVLVKHIPSESEA